MDSDPAFVRFEHPVRSLEQVRERMNLYLAEMKENPRRHFRYAVTIPPGDELRGYVVLTLVNIQAREYEIGWSMHPSEWGKGYATEAASRLLDYAFRVLNARRVAAFCHEKNAASERVMRKLGMKREGQIHEVRWLDGVFWDELVYTIRNDEYLNHTGVASEPTTFD